MKNLYRAYKNILFYSNFYDFVVSTYEVKKKALLEAHRLQKTNEVQKLVVEVNTLSEVLNSKKVNIDDIPGTVEFYSKKVKRVK